jgi:hypothetical protein
MQIKENSTLARLAAWKLRTRRVAMVVGSTIYFYNTSKEQFLADKRWLRHELKHIEQYHRHGTAGFIFRYLLESIRHGYYNNRFEVEARAAENEDWLN